MGKQCPVYSTALLEEALKMDGKRIEWPPITFAETPRQKPPQKTIASGACGENLNWTLDDSGTLTITGTGAMNN